MSSDIRKAPTASATLFKKGTVTKEIMEINGRLL